MLIEDRAVLGSPEVFRAHVAPPSWDFMTPSPAAVQYITRGFAGSITSAGPKPGTAPGWKTWTCSVAGRPGGVARADARKASERTTAAGVVPDLIAGPSIGRFGQSRAGLRGGETVHPLRSLMSCSDARRERAKRSTMKSTMRDSH